MTLVSENQIVCKVNCLGLSIKAIINMFPNGNLSLTYASNYVWNKCKHFFISAVYFMFNFFGSLYMLSLSVLIVIMNNLIKNLTAIFMPSMGKNNVYSGPLPVF
jgi:hypothetical protein